MDVVVVKYNELEESSQKRLRSNLSMSTKRTLLVIGL